MSAPLSMTSDQAAKLAQFLALVTEASVSTGCTLGPHLTAEVGLPSDETGRLGAALRIVWDDEIPAYRVDDRVGD